MLTLESDCDAPEWPRDSMEPLGHLQLYQLFLFRQVPATTIFALFLRPVDPVQIARSYFRSATPAFAAATRNPLSSVASGRFSVSAKSMYIAS